MVLAKSRGGVSLMAAIKIQGFSITGLGQIGTLALPVNVSHMSNCVGQSEDISFGAVEGGRFLVELEGSVSVMQVPLDLAQTGKRLR